MRGFRGVNTTTISLTLLLMSIAFLGCDETADDMTTPRAVAVTAPSCDANVAAADIFRDAPAEVPAEHAEATCILAEQPWTCKMSGESETCCSSGYGVAGKGWMQTCCTNSQAAYTCQEKAGPLHKPSAP